MVIYGARDLRDRSQARELLAVAAAEHWELAPLPPICRQAGGKPCFSGLEHRQFNLSHSGQLALCALDGAPVGVDIQVVKRWRPSLPARTCSPEELAWLEEQRDCWPAFTLLWALKESRAKESGLGLTLPIREIRVPLPAGGGPVQLDGLWFRTYRGDGWAAAACGHVPPPEQILWRSL